MPKGVPNKRYTPEFKQMVVETMMWDKLSYCEAVRQFDVSNHHTITANRTAKRISMLKARLKGLPPALHRQQALSAA